MADLRKKLEVLVGVRAKLRENKKVLVPTLTIAEAGFNVKVLKVDVAN